MNEWVGEKESRLMMEILLEYEGRKVCGWFSKEKSR